MNTLSIDGLERLQKLDKDAVARRARRKAALEQARAVTADLSRIAQALVETARAEAESSRAASASLTEANQILQDTLDRGISTTLLISTVRQPIASLLTQGRRQSW
jgi:hypothetical protein